MHDHHDHHEGELEGTTVPESAGPDTPPPRTHDKDGMAVADIGSTWPDVSLHVQATGKWREDVEFFKSGDSK